MYRFIVEELPRSNTLFVLLNPAPRRARRAQPPEIMIALCSVDWLELYCDFTHFFATSTYKITPRAYGTKFFEDFAEVEFNSMPLCTIAYNPRSAIIRTKTGILKVSNRLLYSQNGLFQVSRFLTECSIQVLSVSRVDIACDFQRFANGMPVRDFISRIMRGEYVLKGRKEITANGAAGGMFQPQYIRWGARSSDIQVYLYNKSKELREVKDKFYIRQAWKEAGLSEPDDVWRVEFSLRGRVAKSLVTLDGYSEAITLDNLSDTEFVRALASALSERYFTIQAPTADTNKSRWPVVPVMEFEYQFIKLVIKQNEFSSKRADKILAKNLWLLAYRSHVTDLRRLHDAASVYEEFIYNAHLVVWAREHEDEWQRLSYRE